MHETTTKRPGRAGKYIRRALLALAAVILAAVLVLLALFQAELRTLNTIERVDDTDLFTMTYLGNKVAFTVPVLGGVPVAESVVVTWIVMAALIALALALTRRLSVDRPGKVQCALEWTVEFLNGFVKTNIGAHWRPFAPWLGTVALYIGLSNLIGVFGLTPPTKDISVTAALALMSMFLIYGAQFRYNGLAGGLKKFAEPMPLLIPINLMEVAIRPLALCMRLFGNILGAFIIMEMLKLLVPVVLPAVFSLYFDLFDGLIQTVVFVFLTTLFTGEGIKEED